MKGELYYQALIDLVAEEGRDFDEVARACGFDPETLLACFEGAPHVTHQDFYDHLGREQINKSAEVLHCPQIRIFFLAGVFGLSEVKELANGLHGGEQVAQEMALEEAARFTRDLISSKLNGQVVKVFDEFIAACFSEDLESACRKTGLPYKRMEQLRAGLPASLKDCANLRAVADAIGIPLTVVLFAHHVIEPGDLVWQGHLVDPMEELKAVMDVEIW